MNDLSQLYQLNPYVASGFQGQREALGQDSDLLKNQELAQLIASRTQDANFKADQHPYDLEKLMLTNAGLREGLPGITGDSSLKVTNARKGQGTLDSDIAEGNNKNMTDIYTRVGTHLGTVANAVEGASDIEAPYILSQSLDALGAPAQTKQALMQRYGGLPAKEMAARLMKDSDQILAETPQMAVAGLETSAHIMTNSATNASHERINQANIDAGKFDFHGKPPATIEDAVRKAKSAKEKAEALEEAASEAMSKGDNVAADLYLRRAQTARLRAAEDASNAGLAGRQTGINVPGVANLPANPQPSATAPMYPGQATPNPQPAPGNPRAGVTSLPPGSRIIGTSKGKPVYQTPDGQRFIGD